MNTTLGIGSLFLEGLLSFFSPCVLPLVPLYLGYLTSGINVDDPPAKKRIRTAVQTFFFVLGISTVFFLAGLGTSAIRSFLTEQTLWISLVGGVLLVLLGLLTTGVIQIPFLEREFRFTAPLKGKMGPLQAYLLGFFFSFAWSPCVGPLLASAIIAAAGASTKLMGWLYIGAYALGFIVIFIILGLFTEEVLSLLKKFRGIVRYAKILSGIVILCMGGYMLYQGVGEINTLKTAASTNTSTASQQTSAQPEDTSGLSDIEKYNVTLSKADGTMVDLKDYRGKTIVLNFFATWCHYCKEELPYLQQLHETRDDVTILLIAAPNYGSEGDLEGVENFMKENGYTMEVLYDTTYRMTQMYGIQGYPTTFVIKADGSYLGYVPGYVSEDNLNSMLEQAAQ